MSFWLQTQTALLDVASTMVGFGVNWLIQSTLLILVGLVAGRLLTCRGAAAESIVYRTTLVAVLLCPLATWIFANMGFAGWSIPMPTAWSYERLDMLSVEKAPPASSPPSEIFLGSADIPSTQRSEVLAPVPDYLAMAPAATAQPRREFSRPSLASSTGSVTISTASGDSFQKTVATNQSSALAIHLFGWAAVGLTVVWFFITFGLLARLVISSRRLARLSHRAQLVEPTIVSLCQELAQTIGVTVPRVLCTPLLPSPCLTGLLRPTILLTDHELSLSVRDVLVHEFAHLRRRDCHWNLLRHIATSLFFFQPLIWTLSRRLERAAEEVCDDYVVEFGGNREEYARRLVDIAELLTTPLGATAVGIVSLRSLLARRVMRILDTSRSLSTHAGRRLLGLILLSGVVGTASVGLVEFGGSWTSLAGLANEFGQYRITPHPGIRFGVIAYAPDGTPYLARQTPFDRAIAWETSDRVKQVDLTIPRGILVRGRVTEVGTENPIEGASIQYKSERANNSDDADDILTGWQAIVLSDEQGQFEIVVLPGPGRLLIHGPDNQYVIRETTEGEIYRGRRSGRRHYTHAIEFMNLDPGQETVDVRIELQPGATVSGRIVDEQGSLVDEALVISRLNISPYSTHWNGHTAPTQGGKFTVGGLADDQQYPVHILDPQRRLGATAILQASDQSPTVVLKPCGQAVMRFVDVQGRPVAGHAPMIEMVVTPGGTYLNLEMQSKGEVSADSDFIQNIDRANYWSGTVSDEAGVLELPVLIPGASYRILDGENDWKIAKDFQVEAGGMLDLGDIVIQRPE